MGFLLKIAVFAVVVYGVWTAARRWLGLFGGLPRPPAPPQPGKATQSPRVVIEDTRLCPACNAYVAANAGKCGRADCPQP
jgi:hypothetical protein